MITAGQQHGTNSLPPRRRDAVDREHSPTDRAQPPHLAVIFELVFAAASGTTDSAADEPVMTFCPMKSIHDRPPLHHRLTTHAPLVGRSRQTQVVVVGEVGS